MPSFDHEILVDLFRENGKLAAELLRVCAGIQLDHARIERGSLQRLDVAVTGRSVDATALLANDDPTSKPPRAMTVSAKVDRIVIAFECGAIVNPDGLKNQVEGSVVQGLGGALFEAIEFGDGRLRNGSMEQYRVPRFKDVNTTTEFLTKYLFDRLAEAARAGELGRDGEELSSIRVTIAESPAARAWYEASLS